MKDKFVRKYMRLAREASQSVECLSRGIGAIIVNPTLNCVVSTGWNGPAAGVPHPDSYEFLRDYVYPQLKKEDKKFLLEKFKETQNLFNTSGTFAVRFEGCKTCPRQLIGCKSGERLELCACAHGEWNAVNNAAKAGHSTNGCYLFCWCGVPCAPICTPTIINAGVKRVYCLEGPSGQQPNHVYRQDLAEWMLDKAGVEIFKLKEDILSG